MFSSMRLGLIGTLLVVCAVLAVACGGGSGGGGSDEDQIRRVTDAFFKAFNDGKAGDAYGLLSEQSKRDCSQQDFAGILMFARLFLGDMKLEVKEIRNLRVEGDRATALVVSSLDEGDTDLTEYVREGGRWRIDLGAGGCGLARSAGSEALATL